MVFPLQFLQTTGCGGYLAYGIFRIANARPPYSRVRCFDRLGTRVFAFWTILSLVASGQTPQASCFSKPRQNKIATAKKCSRVQSQELTWRSVNNYLRLVMHQDHVISIVLCAWFRNTKFCKSKAGATNIFADARRESVPRICSHVKRQHLFPQTKTCSQNVSVG